jgi:hypothetical protein
MGAKRAVFPSQQVRIINVIPATIIYVIALTINIATSEKYRYESPHFVPPSVASPFLGTVVSEPQV